MRRASACEACAVKAARLAEVGHAGVFKEQHALRQGQVGGQVVEIGRLAFDQSDFTSRYEPGHPLADADGYIYQPSFDQSGMRTVVSGTIAGDGGLVLKLYYTPKTDTKYTVSYVRLKHDGTTQVATEADGTRIGTTGTAVDAGAIAKACTDPAIIPERINAARVDAVAAAVNRR